MKITAIKQQVKRPERYSIYIDDKFAFGLSESAVLAMGLRIGQELTASELDGLKDDARLDKAYGQVLSLLARRARSEWEVRDYLKRKDYEAPLIEQVVDRAHARGYLDDEAFARMWVENRRLLKATSRRKLNLELKQKRVASDIIERVLADDREVTDERAVLRELIARKRRRYPDDLKLMQYLARQGYQYDDIKSALDETAAD